MQLYRRVDGRDVSLTPVDAEFAKPDWQFGQASYAFGPGGDVYAIGRAGGRDTLWRVAPDGAMRALDLPYTDLYNGARDYFSAGFPVLRNIFESFGSKQNTFTGAPLGEKMVPLSGIWAAPGLRHLVAALPWAEEGPEGQVFIPDTIDNVLAGIPIYSRYRNWMLSDPERVEKRTATVFSAMLGLGLVRDDATAVELAFYYDEILPTMERLKSMGYVFPTKDQLEDAGALVYDYGAMPSAEELFPTGVAGAIPQPGA